MEGCSWILGDWAGKGTGRVEDRTFEYNEEFSFKPTPRPIFLYQQTTSKPDGTPLHLESGFLKKCPEREGGVDFILSHVTSSTEIAEGAHRKEGDKQILELRASPAADPPVGALSRASTAKDPAVLSTRRLYWVEADKPDVLKYEFYMSTTSHPEPYLHLEGTLARSS